MPGHQHVQSGRITAPNFQSIEGRQRHLNGPPPVQGGTVVGKRDARRHQVRHAPSHSQPVALDGPAGVFEADQDDVDRLLLLRRQLQGTPIQHGVEAGHFGGDAVDRGADAVKGGRGCKQAPQSRCAA